MSIRDYGAGYSGEAASTVAVSQIEEYLLLKPEEVTLRWVHVPMGLGLVRDSVEDIYNGSTWTLVLDSGTWRFRMYVPWQLGEGTCTTLLDTDIGTNPPASSIEEQVLSRHPGTEAQAL